jgi:hypothetical protein
MPVISRSMRHAGVGIADKGQTEKVLPETQDCEMLT